MYQKKYRLKKEDIEHVARKGKRYPGELFDIRAWYDDSKELPQFSIAVSKKIDKRAIVRNTIKRKFRVAIYELLQQNFFKKGSYLFVIKDVSVEEKKSGEIEELIKMLLDK